MKIKALTTFVHGSLSLSRGEESQIPESSAQDLIKAGLIVEVKAREVENKAAPKPQNKGRK